MPVFKNVENSKVMDSDSKEYWISRAVAVVVIPLFRLPDGSVQVPTGIRSNTTPDQHGKAGLVCGYLDWNESAFEAVKREAWEELGVDLGAYFRQDEEPQPCFVQSHPSQDDRQNVTLRYRFMIDVEELPELKTSKEVDHCLWIRDHHNYKAQCAFNHASLISEAFYDQPRQFKFDKNGPPIVF